MQVSTAAVVPQINVNKVSPPKATFNNNIYSNPKTMKADFVQKRTTNSNVINLKPPSTNVMKNSAINRLKSPHGSNTNIYTNINTANASSKNINFTVNANNYSQNSKFNIPHTLTVSNRVS